jgi:hypothetical protein
LSEVLDDDQPKAFSELIQGKDYGLSASLTPDKKTLNKFGASPTVAMACRSAQARGRLTNNSLIPARW